MRFHVALIAIFMTLSGAMADYDGVAVVPGQLPGARALLRWYGSHSTNFEVRNLSKPFLCAETSLVGIFEGDLIDLPKPEYWGVYGESTATAFVFANGAVEADYYEVLSEAKRARTGDGIRMCLLHIIDARDCPIGDHLTRTYYVYDHRTREDWIAADGPDCAHYGEHGILPITRPQSDQPNSDDVMKRLSGDQAFREAHPLGKNFDPLHRAGYDKPFDCLQTAISWIGSRLVNAGESGKEIEQAIDKINESGEAGSLGSSIKFSNGVSLVDYSLPPELSRTLPSDRMEVCLVHVPKDRDCPAPTKLYGKDRRGRMYSVRNLRTGENWLGFDSQHMCGGL